MFHSVILSAVFRFAKRTGIRSRRTPRLPAPPVLPMGILNTILDADAPNLTLAKHRLPHRSAFCAERWETRISTSARHSLLKQDEAGRLPRLKCPPLKSQRAKQPQSFCVSRCHFLHCHPERSIPVRKANRNTKSKDPASARTTSIAHGNSKHDPRRRPTQSHPRQAPATPSFRVLCGKVGNENLDKPPAFTSKTRIIRVARAPTPACRPYNKPVIPSAVEGPCVSQAETPTH
jgi:hypothetical protein